MKELYELYLSIVKFGWKKG